MKTRLPFMGLMAFLCLSLFTTDLMAQSSCTSKSKTTTRTSWNDGNSRVSVSQNENNGNFNLTMNFPREQTTSVQNYLVKELGSNYTTHTAGLKRWTKSKSMKGADGLKVSLSKGYIKIAYKGTDDDTLEEIKALSREVRSMLNERKG